MSELNPFKDDYKININFSNYCQSFLSNLTVGDSKVLDKKGRSLAITRMSLKYASEKLKLNIKTKVNFSGDLFVLVVKK